MLHLAVPMCAREKNLSFVQRNLSMRCASEAVVCISKSPSFQSAKRPHRHTEGRVQRAPPAASTPAHGAVPDGSKQDASARDDVRQPEPDHGINSVHVQGHWRHGFAVGGLHHGALCLRVAWRCGAPACSVAPWPLRLPQCVQPSTRGEPSN